MKHTRPLIGTSGGEWLASLNGSVVLTVLDDYPLNISDERDSSRSWVRYPGSSIPITSLSGNGDQ